MERTRHLKAFPPGFPRCGEVEVDGTSNACSTLPRGWLTRSLGNSEAVSEILRLEIPQGWDIVDLSAGSG